MSIPRFIDIDSKRYLWRDLPQRRREQLAAIAKVEQPTLFALRNDCRITAHRAAGGRYREPSLFSEE
jgi:hypothetical protein